MDYKRDNSKYMQPPTFFVFSRSCSSDLILSKESSSTRSFRAGVSSGCRFICLTTDSRLSSLFKQDSTPTVSSSVSPTLPLLRSPPITETDLKLLSIFEMNAWKKEIILNKIVINVNVILMRCCKVLPSFVLLHANLSVIKCFRFSICQM